MAREFDPNYYPLPFPGGSSRVASVASGQNTMETHEFYNEHGKVVFKWKIIKDSDNNLIDFRIYIPDEPAAAAASYKDFDTLS